MTYKVSTIPKTQDIVGFLTSQDIFPDNLIKNSLNDFSFYEFSMDELGLPSPQELLNSVLNIKNTVGIKGWMSNGVESQSYRGFSLTYNPDFHDSESSIYHQTWGSSNLLQSYGREKGLGNFSSIRNTYYDTYAFRNQAPVIEAELGYLFNHFSCPLLRSRVAFLRLHRYLNANDGWHVDEPPYHMFRINIPLQTTQEHILEINGKDGHGNYMQATKHLEVGKAYIWNTRIPHRVNVKSSHSDHMDRIHLVLGFGTWIDYNKDKDEFSKSNLYGLSLKTIVEEKLFLKKVNFK
jgi:hypothetical protein